MLLIVVNVFSLHHYGSLWDLIKIMTPYSIKAANGIIQVSFSRQPEVEEFRHAIVEVAHHKNNQFRIWDLSCGVTWTPDESAAIARYAKETFSTPASKVAIIAPDNLTFGLFRVHDVFRQDDLTEQIVFRSAGEAYEWINKNKEINPKQSD